MRKIFKLFIFSLLVSLFVTPTFAKSKTTKSKTLQTQPQINRIVSLGASATEILFAIDAQDKLVAHTDFCNYPEQAKAIKSIGGFAESSISLESIILCEPDLVYAFAGMHDNLIKPLEAVGIKVYVSNATSIKDIQTEILDVGKLVGKEKQAQKVVTQMNQKLTKVTKYVASQKLKNQNKELKVFWQIWANPIMSVGKSSYINDIISYCGAINIFNTEDSPYPIVSEEAIMYANPDFIFFTSSKDLTSIEEIKNRSDTVELSKNLQAKYGIYDVGQNDIFSRPCPRVVDAIETLSKLLWEKVSE